MKRVEGFEIRRISIIACFLAGMFVLTTYATLPVNQDRSVIIHATAHPSGFVASQYESQFRIQIDDNSDFLAEGFSGSGTLEDPYVVSGILIASQIEAISIQNTTAHFIIRDSWISGQQGIALSHVENGIIRNCTVKGEAHGININHSHRITISETEVRESNFGIYANDITQCIIDSCHIHHNDYGINLNMGTMNNITSCDIYTNFNTGICMDIDSSNTTITNCAIGWNGERIGSRLLAQHNAVDTGGNNRWISNRWGDYSGEGAYDIGLGLVVNPLPLRDDTSPLVSGTEDLRIDEGETGYRLQWNSSDDYLSFYEVWRNGERIAEGIWYEGTVVIHLGEIAIGTHNYTAVFIDAAGNSVADIVWVSVLLDIFGDDGAIFVLYASVLSVGLVLVMLAVTRRMR